MLQTANKQYITQTRTVFYANIKIKIPAAFSENLLDQSFDLLEKIDLLYNSYQPYPYFSQINKNAGNWVEVDSTTIEILQKIIAVSTLTNGAYDITAKPLLNLWGFYTKEKKIPSQQEINNFLSIVDYKRISIKNQKVKIEKGQEIITGSFIKAYAIGVLADFLKASGVNDAIINAGGSTILCRNDKNHLNWNINLPNPFDENQKFEQLSISNSCFSLSAKSHNYIEIDGKKLGHIFNCKTGFPSNAIQVGVVCKDAFLSDVLSTALFSVEENDFDIVLKELQAHFDFQAYRIHENGSMVKAGINFKSN